MTAHKTKRSDADILDPADLRDRLIDAALPHIPFDGWGRQAAIEAAQDLGLDTNAALRAFPGGARDMIRWHLQRADRQMLEALEDLNLPEMRVRDRVATAIRVRLEIFAGDRDAIRKALSFLAMPQNAGLAAQSLYRTVDDIWFAAGDTATDWNFYTKRGLLAGVYSSTLLFWLNDKSEGFEDTWAFLDRRISDVMKVPKLTSQLSKAFSFLPRRGKAFREFRLKS